MNCPKDGRRQSYRIDLDIFEGDLGEALTIFAQRILEAKRSLLNYSRCDINNLTISIEKDYIDCTEDFHEPTSYMLITGIVGSDRKK